MQGGIKMKLFVYEGTPREIAEVTQLMGIPPQSTGILANSVPVGADVPEQDEELSVEQIKLVFQRRNLAEPMRRVLRLLYEAGENRIKSDELKEALNYSNPEFRGMLGAFGRRLKNTKGIPDGVRLFDEAWDEDLRQKTWTLPVNVRKALEDLKIV
jgi:hypothetical protein